MLITFALLLLLPCFTAAQKRGKVTSPLQVTASTSLPHTTSAISEFMPHVSAKAIAYQRTSRWLAITGKIWYLLGLWLFLASGVAAKMQSSVRWTLHGRSDLVVRSLPPSLFQIVAYITAFAITMWIWQLPFDLGFIWLEKHYGFGTQSILGYVWDSVRGIIFQAPAALLYRAGYEMLYRNPLRWWMPTWGLGSAGLLFLFVIQPMWLAPMFNHYSSLPASPIRQAISELARNAGIAHAEILVENTSIRSKHVNAYVTGIGPSARIVINDTTLAALPQDQILAMVGHEIGHYKGRHPMLLLGSSIVGLGMFLWCLALVIDSDWFNYKWGIHSNYDLIMLPAISLAAAIFLFVQAPIESGISRNLERRADDYGLHLVNEPEATARLMAGFAERDLADPDPPMILQFWYGSHPTLHERITTALEYRDRHINAGQSR